VFQIAHGGRFSPRYPPIFVLPRAIDNHERTIMPKRRDSLIRLEIIVSVIIFIETCVRVIENRPSVFIEIQIHIIVRITFRVQIELHVVQFAIVDLCLRTLRLSSLQSKDYVPLFLQLSSGLDGPRMFDCAMQNSGSSYRFHEQKAMLRYPLSRARSIDSLFISFYNTCDIRY